jgi:Domain of unknown function (DUF222)
MELGLITTIEGDLRRQCAVLDPDSVPLPEVVGVFSTLERIAKLAEGAKLRLARKLAEAGAAASSGSRDTAEFLSRATGTSVGAAREVLVTSERLAKQSATDAALAKGELSGEQARAVSDAVAVDPTAERGLLTTAKGRSVKDLKRRCAETKANAHPDDRARRDAIHKGRYCRTWTDAEGAWNLAMRHLPEVGAQIEALLAPYTHARHETARKNGTYESRDAYRADALLDLARATKTGGTPKGASRADTKVFVHIDLDTLLAGNTRPGSICRIDGIGPVNVDYVKSLLGEAFVVALIHDSVDIRSVVHLGRQVTAHQRSALEARGWVCEVPGCDVTVGLQIDHREDWSLTRITTLDDLVLFCGHHHYLKTHHGYRLTGPPGNRTWTAPDGTVHQDKPPPDDQPTEPSLFADPAAALSRP